MSIADPFQEGLIKYRGGNYLGAVEAFDRLTKLYPESGEVWLNLGNAYFKLNRYEEAKQSWKKAIEVDPLEEKAYLNLGNLFFKKACYRSAVFYWQLFKKLNPAHEAVFLNLALAYEKMNNLPTAMLYYQEYMKLAKNGGESFKIRQRFEKAEAAYTQHIQAAEKELAQNNTAKAAEYFENAFALYRGTVSDYKTYAALLYKNGELDKAKHFYRLAHSLDGKDAAILINLGVIAEKTYQHAEALWAYHLAKQLPSEQKHKIADRFQTLLSKNSRYISTYAEDALLLMERDAFEEAETMLGVLKTLQEYVHDIAQPIQQLEAALLDIGDPCRKARKVFPAMAKQHEDAGRYDRAVYYYQKLLELEPSPQTANAQELHKKIMQMQQAMGAVISAVLQGDR